MASQYFVDKGGRLFDKRPHIIVERLEVPHKLVLSTNGSGVLMPLRTKAAFSSEAAKLIVQERRLPYPPRRYPQTGNYPHPHELCVRRLRHNHVKLRHNEAGY
jgi:hypothetical protein